MTGGTPEVSSHKSLTLLTFEILHSTNGPMDQWTNGPMWKWTNGPMDQWTIVGKSVFDSGNLFFAELIFGATGTTGGHVKFLSVV